MFFAKHIFNQILAVFPVSLQDFMFGAGYGWSSPIIERFKHSGGEFSLTDKDCSWIASLHYVGRAAGCLIAAGLVDTIGRVKLLATASFLTLLVWASVWTTRKVLLHYLIRFVFGLSNGIVDTAMTIYVAENSSPNLRGIFNNVLCIFFIAGELLAFVIATYMSYEAVAAIIAAFALVNLVSAVLLVEPASYLIMKGRDEKAKLNFEQLRGTGERATNEFQEMKQKLAQVRVHFSWRMYLDRRFRIVAIVNTLSYTTGFPALNALLAFALVPASTFTSNELTIFYGIAQLLGTFVSATIIERYGRRTLYMGSLCISIGTNAICATLHYCLAVGIQVPSIAWLLFATVAIYGAVFAGLVFPLISMARGELMPPQFKAAGVCTSVILNSAAGFVITQTFLPIANTFGMQTNFSIYTVTSLIMLLYVYFCLPETEGLTLMQIQQLFDN